MYRSAMKLDVQFAEFEKLKDAPRWRYGNPPRCNANSAWLQHLAPHGCMSLHFVNASMSSDYGGEG